MSSLTFPKLLLIGLCHGWTFPNIFTREVAETNDFIDINYETIHRRLQATAGAPAAASCENGDRYVIIMAQNKSTDTLKASLAADSSAEVTYHHHYTHTVNGFSATLNSAALSIVQAHGGCSLEKDRKFAASSHMRGRELATVLNVQWNLDQIDSESHMDQKYETGELSGDGVHIYFLDTGINPFHVEFTGRLGEGKNAITDRPAHRVWEWADCHGHGTHSAGVAAGSTFGVAAGANLHAVRVLDCEGNGYASDVIAGLDWTVGRSLTKAHTSVANLGFSGCDSAALQEAVNGATAQGVTIVTPAGNGNFDACSVSPGKSSTNGVLTIGAVKH